MACHQWGVAAAKKRAPRRRESPDGDRGMRSFVLLACALLPTAASYSLVAAPVRSVRAACCSRHAPLRLMDDDLPGDSEEPIDVPSEAMPAGDAGYGDDLGESDIAKEALKAEVGDGLGGARPDKAVVGEILLALVPGVLMVPEQ